MTGCPNGSAVVGHLVSFVGRETDRWPLQQVRTVRAVSGEQLSRSRVTVHSADIQRPLGLAETRSMVTSGR
jgi:hypothetical protein